MSRILLVEDDFYIRDLYNAALVKAGFQVDLAVDGEEGIKKADSQAYDIILLDIMMPKVNGVEVLRHIRTTEGMNKDIPTFLLTNLGQESIINEAFSLGADGYFLKSQLTPAELIDELSEYLKKLANSSLQSDSGN